MPVPLVIAGIAAGVSLLGDLISGVGQKQAADEQARAAEENARLLRQRAIEVMDEGRRQGGLARMAGSKAISGQKVAFATSGVDPSSGTPAALAGDSRLNAELDALTLNANAAREARGIKTQASQLDRQAGAARTAGDWALAGSLLGGLGRSAGMAYNSGVFGKIA